MRLSGTNNWVGFKISFFVFVALRCVIEQAWGNLVIQRVVPRRKQIIVHGVIQDSNNKPYEQTRKYDFLCYLFNTTMRIQEVPQCNKTRFSMTKY